MSERQVGRPQSNGLVETPVMPRLPVMSWLKAKRFCVLVRERLKSRRALLTTLPERSHISDGDIEATVWELPQRWERIGQVRAG